ncbi:MAG: hypothetical protein WC749_07700 [Dehalococcoidia bacterium]
MFALTPDQIALIEQIIGVVLAIYAGYKKLQVDVLTTPTTTSKTVQNVIVPTLPERSWRMSEGTFWGMTFDCPADVKADIRRQVEEAEAQKLTDYYISFPGGSYHINYGMQYSAKGNCHDST